MPSRVRHGKNHALNRLTVPYTDKCYRASRKKIAEHLRLARKIVEILWLENSYGKYIDNLYGIILLCCLLWKINAQAYGKMLLN